MPNPPPMWPSTRMAVLALALSACTTAQVAFVTEPNIARFDADPAGPPAAETVQHDKLYQVLYAGEAGEEAQAAGQRVRLLAWLSAMEFTDAQLASLAELRTRLRELEAEQAAERAALGAQEMERLGPIYAELSALYLTPEGPSETELDTFSERIQAVRTELYADEDPRLQRYRRLRALMVPVRAWVATLDNHQARTLSTSRFFLRKQLGPLVNPGSYGDLTGISWDAGEFRGINSTLPREDEDHMDIGGLWSTESMRTRPGKYLPAAQHTALVLMALQAPGLDAAIAAKRGATAAAGGSTEPVDGSPEPAPGALSP